MQLKYKFYCLLGLLLAQIIGASSATAEVRVAFLRVYDASGLPVHLEPSGPGFFHVAVSYNGQWLHAHPWGGVQLSNDLTRYGVVDAVLVHPGYSEPDFGFVSATLGLPYDYRFSWGGAAYYCSELLAQIFGIAPTTMRFEGEYWRKYFAVMGEQPPQGVGVSPDRLFAALLQLGFQNDSANYLQRQTSIKNPCELPLSPGDQE